MINKWLQRLRGGDSAQPAEPATAPEPPSMPSEPAADTGLAEEDVPEPPGDTPA